jgi:hypothetical protein
MSDDNPKEPPGIDWQPIFELFDDLMEEHEGDTKKAMREFVNLCRYDDELEERALNFAFDMIAQIT